MGSDGRILVLYCLPRTFTWTTIQGALSLYILEALILNLPLYEILLWMTPARLERILLSPVVVLGAVPSQDLLRLSEERNPKISIDLRGACQLSLGTSFKSSHR